ncbi:MAG: hypothetical protein JWN99_129 [Ilumatobacteraceae bacterium]|nr:hypothetical protein [Ilumatobacteraceae bacterium]
MPKPKMKSMSPPEHVQHLVIIDVDGVQEDVLVADQQAAEALAERVLAAAEQLATVRVPIGMPGIGGEVVAASHVVFDFAKVRRTEVTVMSRSMQTASMGIKR